MEGEGGPASSPARWIRSLARRSSLNSEALLGALGGVGSAESPAASSRSLGAVVPPPRMRRRASVSLPGRQRSGDQTTMVDAARKVRGGGAVESSDDESVTSLLSEVSSDDYSDDYDGYIPRSAGRDRGGDEGTDCPLNDSDVSDGSFIVDFPPTPSRRLSSEMRQDRLRWSGASLLSLASNRSVSLVGSATSRDLMKIACQLSPKSDQGQDETDEEDRQ